MEYRKRWICLVVALVNLIVAGCAGTALRIESEPTGAGVYAKNKLAPPVYLGTTPLVTQYYQGAPINDLYVHSLGYLESESIRVPLTGKFERRYVLTPYRTAAREQLGAQNTEFLSRSVSVIDAVIKAIESSSVERSAARANARIMLQKFFQTFPDQVTSVISRALEESDLVLGLGGVGQRGKLDGEFLHPDRVRIVKASLEDLRAVLVK